MNKVAINKVVPYRWRKCGGKEFNIRDIDANAIRSKVEYSRYE